MRDGASTSLQPKRRASTDHKPGPSIARAPPIVPSRTGTHGSPGNVRICQISVKATNVPAMGVHSPGTRRIPDPPKSAEVIVVFIGGGSLQSVELARTISTKPTTTRMRSNPMPGQPPANVEYRRRNCAPFRTLLGSVVAEPDRKPKKSRDRHSLEFGIYLQRVGEAGGN